MITNARMYAVSAVVEAAWRSLLDAVAREAGVALRYEPYTAPQPLERLWARGDLGLVFMCGWPFAKTWTAIRPVATPIPIRFGAPVYATDLVVRADGPLRTLADTFGHRIGWTVDHSQSGFNAPRHHLLPFRTPDRPHLYSEAIGGLVTARRVVEAVIAGEIEVGPLDAYWHELLKHHEAETAAKLRVVATTEPTPAPLLVASPGSDVTLVGRLAATLASLSLDGPHGETLDTLRIAGFAPAERATYRRQLDQAAEAEAAGYLSPG